MVLFRPQVMVCILPNGNHDTKGICKLKHGKELKKHMEEQAKTIAELLKLLANEHRLLILCALIKGQLTVGDIHKCVPNITASALSQHLNQLKNSRNSFFRKARDECYLSNSG